MMNFIHNKISCLVRDPTDVYSAIHPLYYVCAITGLAPYCIKRLENGKKTFQFAVWPIVRSVILVILFIALVTYNLILNMPDSIKGEAIKDKLWYFQEIFGSFLSCCSVGFGCIFAKKIIEAFRNIDEVDMAFRSLAVWVPYKNIHVKIWVHLICLSAVAFLLLINFIMFPSVILEVHNSEKSSIYLGLSAYVTLILPYLINILMELQYGHYLNILRMRYKLLNEYLEALAEENKTYNGWMDENDESLTNGVGGHGSILKTSGGKPSSLEAAMATLTAGAPGGQASVARAAGGKSSILKSIVSISDPVFIVDQAASLHIKLTDTAHLINYAFCVQQLLRITVAFVSIVTALFLIAVNFSKPSASSGNSGSTGSTEGGGGVGGADDDDTASHAQLNVFFTSWAFSNACEVMAIVWITSETCEEANTSPRILHKIRNATTNIKLQDTIEIYSLQMYHNRLSFTVCGLFPLDYTLLYTIVAGVTTYLVILIQFSNADFIRKMDNYNITPVL